MVAPSVLAELRTTYCSPESYAAVAELIRVGERARAALPVLSGLIHGMYGPESGGVKKAEMLVAELDAALARAQGGAA